MDLEVVGRHALLFDDDSAAAFVNSDAALVEWNSLSIDRYDVRHLLSGPPPPRNRRRHHHPASPNHVGSLESKFDQERYLDLPSSPYEQDLENEVERENAGGYRAVAFSYGGSIETSDQKNTDTESGFQPPFSVPEHLLQSLMLGAGMEFYKPPSEKVHHIIARTAMFVRKHGGQSEIILRVKQGDNPTFGFLMPDHNLHPYFRFLVDHQELLMSGTDGRAIEEEIKTDSGLDQMSIAGGALSLLGSVYGTGEDEEGTTENASASKSDSEEAGNASDNLTVSHGYEQHNSSLSSTLKDELLSKPSIPLKDKPPSKPSIPSLKERSHVIKRNHCISTAKAETATKVKKEADSVVSVSTEDKLQSSTSPGLSKVETNILEPPSELKRVVDKIVEFILRNGEEFEAVLVQQDTKHGRFPFLLPSNQYHPYYLKALQTAQEPRLSGKLGHGLDKKTGSKKSDGLSSVSDIPYESDRKEKFKMVIGKSKKDGQEPLSKASQPQVGVSVDAAQAAAILQAATKGIKHPNLGMLSKVINAVGQGPSSEGGESLPSSQPQTLNHKQDQNGVPCVSVHAAKAIANSAALAAASEADSTEASLTREQKLKAERLKRAKMFAALIKSGAAPLKGEQSRGLSVDPSESGSDSQVVARASQERESSLVPLDVDAHNKIEKPEKKGSADEHTERRSKRSYRSRSRREEEEEEEEDQEEEESGEGDHRHSRKKRRSHHSSHHSRDRHKHRKKHSSSKKTESLHQVKDSNTLDDERNHNQDSSGDEHRRSRHKHKYGNSLDDERYSRRRHRHGSSDDEYIHSRNRHKHNQDTSEDEYDYEHRHSRHRHKFESSSDDEGHSKQRHRRDSFDDEYSRSRNRRKHNRSDSDDDEAYSKHQHKHGHREKYVKHIKRSQSEREVDLEEGEILTKSDQSKVSESGNGVSREASVEISKSYEEVKLQSQQSETAEVPNDLRAKVRAMLMATL